MQECPIRAQYKEAIGLFNAHPLQNHAQNYLISNNLMDKNNPKDEMCKILVS
jgi:hypothetical protein